MSVHEGQRLGALATEETAAENGWQLVVDTRTWAQGNVRAAPLPFSLLSLHCRRRRCCHGMLLTLLHDGIAYLASACPPTRYPPTCCLSTRLLPAIRECSVPCPEVMLPGIARDMCCANTSHLVVGPV